MDEIIDRLKSEATANRRKLEHAKQRLDEAQAEYDKALTVTENDELAISDYHRFCSTSPQLETLNIPEEVLNHLHYRGIYTVYALKTFLQRHWRIIGLTDKQHRTLRVMLKQSDPGGAT